MEHLKNRVYRLLESKDTEDKTAQYVQLIVLLLIVISVGSLIVETVPNLNEKAYRAFAWIEKITVAFFTVEYLTRLWSCTTSERFQGTFTGRLRFITSPMAIIDLLAILPFYLTLIPIDLRFLRFLRMLRIFRLAKLARYSGALQVLGNVVINKRFELGVTLFIGLILLIVSSSLVYFAENAVQPDRYSSIPATMWWSIATLTTVGYGDIYPITTFGKIAGSVVAITGIGMFALPTGILGAAFVEEMSRKSDIKKYKTCPDCGLSFEEV